MGEKKSIIYQGVVTFMRSYIYRCNNDFMIYVPYIDLAGNFGDQNICCSAISSRFVVFIFVVAACTAQVKV